MTQRRPPIVWSRHAVARYIERVRDLTNEQARLELSRLSAQATEIHANPPSWVTASEVADAWLHLADGTIACPLVAQQHGVMLATSLLVQGMISDKSRKRRSLRAADHRAGKRAPKDELPGERRAGPDPDPEQW